MTDQELQQTVQELTESVDKLSNTDKPLTGKEKEQKRILLLKRSILQKIKEARESNDKKQELDLTMSYGLLTSIGEKHPLLMFFVRSKLGMDFL